MGILIIFGVIFLIYLLVTKATKKQSSTWNIGDSTGGEVEKIAERKDIYGV